YVAGGAVAAAAVADLYAYDPVGDSWAPKRPMPTRREHLASCAAQGKLLGAGGPAAFRAGLAQLHPARLYYPATAQWASLASLPALPTARGGLAATLLGGVCHVVGGEDLGKPPPNTFPQNEGFSLQAGAWSTFAPLPTPRHGLAAAALGSSMYVIAGGPTAG